MTLDIIDFHPTSLVLLLSWVLSDSKIRGLLLHHIWFPSPEQEAAEEEADGGAGAEDEMEEAKAEGATQGAGCQGLRVAVSSHLQHAS